MPMRPFSMRETLDADQPSCSATSLPCRSPTSRSRRSSCASRRSRTDGLSTTDTACMESCNLASQLSHRAEFVPPCSYGRTGSTSSDRRTDEMTATTAVPALERYDLYDIAYLAGGPYGVVDTALVALAETGRVRVSETGELSAVGLRRRNPVEAAVLDALGPRPRRSVGTVRWRLQQDERITRLGERLRADGLVTG